MKLKMEPTAHKRVEKFLNERAKIKRLDPVIITGLHSGDEHKEADLTVEDLREILIDNARLREAVLRCVPCSAQDEGEFVIVQKCAIERLFSALPNVQAQR